MNGKVWLGPNAALAMAREGYSRENVNINNLVEVLKYLVGDFIFDQGNAGGELGGKVLHCRNAPSPAATSSLAIASLVVDKMETIWGFK